MDTGAFRTFIDELTEVSAAAIRPLFGDAGLQVQLKPDRTPVTQADREAEAAMRKLIGRRFPDHGILGEELGAERPDAEFVWVLDPVDGTKSFASACPLFGTLIALQHRGVPILGAIHQPLLNQLLVGDGTSTMLNGRPVRCRATSRIEDSTFLTTSWTSPEKHQNGAAFDALARRVRLARTWGDCYGYLLLASGWADIMCDPIMNPWDIAALIPIVRGAGGVITDWQGRDPIGADSIVAAATPGLHADVIAALNPA